MKNSLTTAMKIQSPASRVFQAIVNPEQMANYWFSSGSERMEEGITITWRYEEYNAEGIVYVLEVQDPAKIVFTWGDPDQPTTVTIKLKEQDSESTIISVTESGFSENPDLERMLGQKAGWVYMLTCLKAYTENGVNTLRASLVHS
ncbi:SRPBCC family protein [Bacillus sp. SCS-153A]|uniref:SRPBCC family protein n=1 Tax=Rossellomorea sedimentorum TaxID=3115294 RepID=UPI003905C365